MNGSKGRSNGSDRYARPGGTPRPRAGSAAARRHRGDPGPRLHRLERRCAGQLGAQRVAVADDLWAGLLRGRDDAHRRQPLRPRPVRRGVPAEPAPIRRDDRRRHLVQQDGAGLAQGLRPDGRAALGHLDGLLRQWRWLLPLLLLGSAGLRPHRAGRYLRAGLSAHRRGAAVRRAAAAEENPPDRDDRTLTMDETLDTLGKTVAGELAPSVTGYAVAYHELTVAANAPDIVAVMRFLR